jgi:mono/diheme cytochrome c family protein
MRVLVVVLALGLAGLMGAVGFIYSGFYPMGADVPHYAWVHSAIDTFRERSIERAARETDVPPLDSPQLLLSGGADYNDMCSGCHLKPGASASDMSLGLYPRPPNLTQWLHAENDDSVDANTRRQFWIIKHGIKASGMPAWGATHDDQRIWAMVAFLQKLPQLTPEQYQILTSREKSVHFMK